MLYGYDLRGNLTSVTDAVGNVTRFAYDNWDRKVYEQINVEGQTFARAWQYDIENNLTLSVDRNGRATAFSYDEVDRLDTEVWYSNGTDAESGSNADNTIITTYDILNRVHSMADDFSSYTYGYDAQDRVVSISNSGTPGVAEVVLTYGYDTEGRKISTAATIGGVADFLTAYTYTGRDLLASITQTGQGGNAVANKKITYSYDVEDQLDQIARYTGAAMDELVATTSYTYDSASRLTDLIHAQGATTLANYQWTFDSANRVTSFDSLDGLLEYAYDDRGQLLDVDLDGVDLEAYTYDENGNRLSDAAANTYDTPTDSRNRLMSDGTYSYQYDGDGNRIKRTHIANGTVTEYAWDTRNRLIGVTERVSVGGAITSSVQYAYDMNNRRIAKQIDVDGDGAIDQTIRQVYDGDHIALQFEDQNGDGIADATELTHRYLHGMRTDEILADEQVTDVLQAGNVIWPLADNLGSVRDLADHDETTGTTSVVNHRVYDAFGNITSETNPSVEHIFGYTGREFDRETGLNFYRARYYDATVGQFISEDPIGFEAGDANLFRYVGNESPNDVDPSGMVRPTKSNFTLELEKIQRTKGNIESIVKQLQLGAMASKPGEPILIDPNGIEKLEKEIFSYRVSLLGLHEFAARTGSDGASRAVFALPQGQVGGVGIWIGAEINHPNSVYQRIQRHTGQMGNNALSTASNLSTAIQILTYADYAVATVGIATGIGGLAISAGKVAAVAGTRAAATYVAKAVGTAAAVYAVTEAGIYGLELAGASQEQIAVAQFATNLVQIALLHRAQVRAGRIAGTSPTSMNPEQIRFSQNSAGGRGRAAQLRESMTNKGWNGPAVDAVNTSKGVVTIDNTRIAIARELGITDIPVNVRSPSDPLPKSMLGRFGNARTWGEALHYRTSNQRPPLPATGTLASPRLPK